MIKKYTLWREPDDSIDMACECNFHLGTLLVDYDNLQLICSVCGHKESFPEYAIKFPEEGIKDYYAHPIRKDKTFGRGLQEIFKNSFWSAI